MHFFVWFVHRNREVVAHTAGTGRTESVFPRDTYIWEKRCNLNVSNTLFSKNYITNYL